MRTVKRRDLSQRITDKASISTSMTTMQRRDPSQLVMISLQLNLDRQQGDSPNKGVPLQWLRMWQPRDYKTTDTRQHNTRQHNTSAHITSSTCDKVSRPDLESTTSQLTHTVHLHSPEIHVQQIEHKSTAKNRSLFRSAFLFSTIS